MTFPSNSYRVDNKAAAAKLLTESPGFEMFRSGER